MSTPSAHIQGPTDQPSQRAEDPGSGVQRHCWLALLIFGYIGVYLCRKNLSVAIPLLQEKFNATRAEVGLIASYSTVAYATGKFLFGALVDRVGGRVGLIASLFLVGMMGIAGGFAPSLGMLAIFYSLNRFAGAASWPAMVKLTPDWFHGKELPFAIALLSLSFVIGGALATVFAGLVLEWSGGNWRMVMAVPSVAPLLFVILAFWLLPKPAVHKSVEATAKTGVSVHIASLLRLRTFWIICALSFVLTLLRETFNTWTVDFIKTQGGPEVSNQIAAFLSTPFDLFGALGILTVGWFYGRLQNRGRKFFLSGMLGLLALIIWGLPYFFHFGLTTVTIAVGLIGFLTYGPYSLLGGTLAVEVRGPQSAGTVSGFVDGVGYLAGILAGAQFGKLVDVGGYSAGFQALAVLAFISAILCFALYGRAADSRQLAA